MLKDKENQKRIAREWYERNKELTKQRAREWALANPEKRKKSIDKWRKENREQHNQTNRDYFAQNPEKRAAHQAKRRAAKLQRTPCWLTSEGLWLIEEYYHLAQKRTELLGFPRHVDHIIPLRGRNVSGLHVPENLQVIPGIENIKKSNKYDNWGI